MTPQPPGILDVSRQPLTKQAILRPDSEYRKSIDSLVQQRIRQESDREQTHVYAKVRRNNLYYRGKQFLALYRGSDGSIDYRPVNDKMEIVGYENTAHDELYDNILPLFRGDVRKWCGVLGVRAPNAKCSPRTVGEDHQIRLSRIGDRAISYLKECWQADAIQRYMAYSLAVNGTTFGYVNFVADGKKFGYSEIPQLKTVMAPQGEPVFVCARCGTENPLITVQQSGRCAQCENMLGAEDYREPEAVPTVIQTGVDRYPNGAVELQIGTAATVKTPYYCNDIDDAPWIWYEYLVNRYELMRAYAPMPPANDRSEDARFRRELRSHLESDRTTDSFGASTAEIRRTVNTLSSPSGSPFERKSLAALGQYFVSPAMMESMPDDESGSKREQMLAKYPGGAHFIYISGMLADVRNAVPSEHWSICQPDVGDFIYRDAVFDDYIQGQDTINDVLNILIQQAEKSNPLTFFDPDIVDPDYLRNRQVQTGELLEAKKGVGSQLSSSFYRIPPAELNETLVRFLELYIAKNRENVGIMPAMFGGGEADEAVGVAKIRRNQSLMQLNIPWNYMRSFWSRTYMNGIRLLAKYSNGKLYTSKGGSLEVEELNGIWELRQGGVKIECEEAMPMSWAQRQEQIDSMLERPPQAWNLLGLADMNGQPVPANVEALQDGVGLPDWQVPGLAARERLMDIIQELVVAAPMDQPPLPPQIGPDGMPIPAEPQPPQPSIAPNDAMFDAPFAVTVLRDWLVSDKGREAERGELPKQDPRGFENVLAYTRAWMLIANPPPPPMLPGGAPGPNGEAPPPADDKAPPDQRGVAAPSPVSQQGVSAEPPQEATPTGQMPGMIQ